MLALEMPFGKAFIAKAESVLLSIAEVAPGIVVIAEARELAAGAALAAAAVAPGAGAADAAEAMALAVTGVSVVRTGGSGGSGGRGGSPRLEPADEPEAPPIAF